LGTFLPKLLQIVSRTGVIGHFQEYAEFPEGMYHSTVMVLVMIRR
jgi:hypothetical protein